MLTSSDYNRINNEFNQIQQKRRKKISKIWFYLLLSIIVVIVILIFAFPYQFKNENTVWILPVYGGLAFLTTLIGCISSLNYNSEKPYFTYLFNSLIEKINIEEELSLQYESYPKEKYTYNIEGGLFTRFATVKNRRHMDGKTEQGHKFDIFDCIMTTSNGKSQQTHFDGIYFVLHKNINTFLQVRTQGTPKLKATKYKRQDGFETLKVFKKEDESLHNIDYQYIKFIESIKPDYKRIYLSIVNNQIHLALWYKKRPTKKHKELTYDKLEELSLYLKSEYQFILKVDTIGDLGERYEL